MRHAAALLLSAGLASAASADGPPAGPNPAAVQHPVLGFDVEAVQVVLLQEPLVT